MTANVDTSLGGTLQFEILNEYGYRVRVLIVHITSRFQTVRTMLPCVSSGSTHQSSLSNENKYSVRVLFSKTGRSLCSVPRVMLAMRAYVLFFFVSFSIYY